MTTPVNDRVKGPDAGNGVTLAFGFDFLIKSTSEVRVTIRDEDGVETVQVETTDYTVAGLDDPDGGTVTFLTAPASGEEVIIEGVTARNQSTAYTSNDRFPAASHEGALDRDMRINQEQDAQIARAFKAKIGHSAEVPYPEDGLLLGWDGTQLANKDPATFTSDLLLGSSWRAILEGVAGAGLAALKGIKYFATYAAMTAALTATGLADDTIFCTYGRAAEEDGGFGFWRYDAASVATANGGTILAINGGGAGRFFRSYDPGLLSVLWFGADRTGVTASTTAFQAAADVGGLVIVPDGTYDVGKLTIVTACVFQGANQSRTVIRRNYSPSNVYDGIFNFRNGSSYSGLRQMTLYSKVGQTGGCLVSIVVGASDAMGIYAFEDIDCTTLGTSTHETTVHLDGSAKVTGAVGLRGVEFRSCNLFGGSNRTLYCSGVLKLGFFGGGTYAAGGAAGSNVTFTGNGTVPTQAVQFLPADNSCDMAFDYCTNMQVKVPTAGAITNSSNASYIQGEGNYNSIQNFWANSSWKKGKTNAGDEIWGANGVVIDAANKRLGVNVAAPGIAIEALGQVSGYAKSASVTQIGQVCYPYPTPCATNQTFTFTTVSGGLFWIAHSGGAAVLCFADYKSATISLLSNPSSEFENSSTPTAGKTGIFKSANSHVISVINKIGSTVTYSVQAVNNIGATTDPA